MNIEKLQLHVNEEPVLLDMEATAKYLNIKLSCLYQLCMRKQITVVKIGRLNRFRKADLERFISGNVVEAENHM